MTPRVFSRIFYILGVAYIAAGAVFEWQAMNIEKTEDTDSADSAGE
jgi:hypothetical protein